ncbi:ParA-like plasmid partition protein [Gigaspora margarita]|uniref:ParA-like plasmid partition protein n=1 Tax=Gigaspora margarita TaxID=4874 RepID=A0A8H4ADH5_GIGMA|nr:ParA-like plasmid partition protein [Gigaspora margarita]
MALTRLSTLAEAKAIQEYLKKAGYAFSPYFVMEKASYKQVQNEGKTEAKYQSLAKQAKELVNIVIIVIVVIIVNVVIIVISSNIRPSLTKSSFISYLLFLNFS